MVNRAEEIRSLNRLEPDELVARAGGRLVVLESLDALHGHMACEMAGVIRDNNTAGKSTAMIVPYGPTGQYPILRDLINSQQISLRRTTLFFMDEYADEQGRAVAPSHPCSFRGGIQWFFDALAPELRPDPKNVVFPTEDQIDSIDATIADCGGLDACFGGVGIHGHLAFNEPAPGVRDSGNRFVQLNEFTVTMNAIRSGVGGDLENFPRYALTLGMRQCLSACKLRIYCRNDVAGLDWANTVLRLAVLGSPGDDYPVTHIRDHADWMVMTDRNTAVRPRHAL